MKIAITGTIGSGKSTVSEYLRNKGFYVFDCDAYNSKLLEKDNIGYLLIKDVFSDAFVDDELDKSKLAKIIFSDKERKQLLESILHPFIIDMMENESLKHDIFFAEVPLLFENKLESMFDTNILITCDNDIAINRLIDRGMKYDDIISRINSQMDVENKLDRADEIIYNNDNLDVLYSSIDNWLKEHVG